MDAKEFIDELVKQQGPERTAEQQAAVDRQVEELRQAPRPSPLTYTVTTHEKNGVRAVGVSLPGAPDPGPPQSLIDELTGGLE